MSKVSNICILTCTYCIRAHTVTCAYERLQVNKVFYIVKLRLLHYYAEDVLIYSPNDLCVFSSIYVHQNIF